VAFYLLLLGAVFVLNASAVNVALLSAGMEHEPAALFTKQFFAPLMWNELALLHGT